MKTIKKAATWMGHFIWPDLVMFYGLGLCLDNWGRNHGSLVFVGAALFSLGIEKYVRKLAREEIRAATPNKENP